MLLIYAMPRAVRNDHANAPIASPALVKKHLEPPNYIISQKEVNTIWIICSFMAEKMSIAIAVAGIRHALKAIKIGMLICC